MLQIKIVTDGHYQYIYEIKNLDTQEVLAAFDEKENKIPLEPMVPYIGEQVTVSHYIQEGEDRYFDYEHVQTINKVDKDEDGLWFIEWSE